MVYVIEWLGGEFVVDNGQVVVIFESWCEVGCCNFNCQIVQCQKVLLIGVGVFVFVGGVMFLFSGDNGKGLGVFGEVVMIDIGGFVNCNLFECEFVVIYGNWVDVQDWEIKVFKEGQVLCFEFEQQFVVFKIENVQMCIDGQYVIDVILVENVVLKMQFDQVLCVLVVLVMLLLVYGFGVILEVGILILGVNW